MTTTTATAAREYRDLVWSAPFDLEAYINAIPAKGALKGMFFRDIEAQLQKNGKSMPNAANYTAFKDYPLRDYMRVCYDTSRILFPGASPREGLRRLGWSIYDTFTRSMVGKVMIGVLNNNLVSIMKTMNKAASVGMNTGYIETLEAKEGMAVLFLRDVYFIDTFQVGVLEGCLKATNKVDGKVRIHAVELTEAYLQVTWKT